MRTSIMMFLALWFISAKTNSVSFTYRDEIKINEAKDFVNNLDIYPDIFMDGQTWYLQPGDHFVKFKSDATIRLKSAVMKTTFKIRNIEGSKNLYHCQVYEIRDGKPTGVVGVVKIHLKKNCIYRMVFNLNEDAKFQYLLAPR